MKKGFTLIELLAVIIILAIIALIATPMVLNVVDAVKESAAKTEAIHIVDGVNKYCALADAKHQLDQTTELCTDKDYTKADIANKMVEGGNYDSATVTFANTKVTTAKIVSNGYTVTYNNGTYSVSK